jgi:hypothetical protein
MCVGCDLFVYLFIYPAVYSFMYLFIYLFIYGLLSDMSLIRATKWAVGLL